MHSTAPFSKLYISDRNVRKTDVDLDIEPLADDIAAHGLIENLACVDEGKGRGRLGIVAGGRRYRALQLLDKAGRWPADKLDRNAIPISLGPVEEGREISLSENLHKVIMNPADEVVAYSEIVADYEARGEADPMARLERCARHFGKTVRYVEQRLRLATLAPDILEALRLGKITLDAAKAYAAVGDQRMQLEIFAAQERQGHHSVHAIRAALAGKVYRKGDKQVRYVGIEGYLEAGGRIERDLFMGAEDEEVLLDTALLDRLALEKAEREAEELGKAAGHGGGLVKPWGSNSYYALPKTPAGFEPAWHVRPRLRPDELGQTIAIFEVAADGSGLEILDTVFKKAPPPGEAAPVRSAETEIERLARIRREAIHLRALRLAAPPLHGTPLEGRAFWPPEHAHWIDPVQEDEDGNFVVAVLVRIPREDVDQVMTAAEALLDQEEGARDAAKAAAAAGAEEAGEESEGDLERDDVVGEAVE